MAAVRSREDIGYNAQPMELSVIIPTHRRPAILQKCLRALELQTIRRHMEVIVVSDGHDSETAALFSDASTWTIPIRFIEIEKSQQAVARNRGIAEAKANVVLLLNDDMIPSPDCCERHAWDHAALNAKGSPPSAILGHMTWDPDCGITPVMRWLETTGWQFGFDALKPYAGTFIPPHLQHKFTYANNMSLRTETARKYPFREDVSGYGWEDIVWGKQLKDGGVRLYYEPRATALHHHHLEMADSLTRMEHIGRSAAKIATLDPSFDPRPTGWKLTAYRLLALLPTMRGRHAAALLRGMQQ